LMQQKDSGVAVEDAINGQLQHVMMTNVLSCRICGKETNSELALAHHLQSSHRQREMPYVCRLCLFRSSLFEDILDHFKKFHDNSNHLLCTYCLRIFTPSDARSPHYASPTGAATLVPGVGQTQVYLQHLRMHQVRHQLRRCPTCRLNFTNKSDYQVHRRLDHKAVRDGTSDRPEEAGLDGYEATDQTVRRLKETQPHITLMNAPEAGGVMDLVLLHFPPNIGEMRCLECGEPMDSDAHRRYLPCSLCRFATCCSAGYNRHVTHVHVYVAGTQQAEPDSGMPMIRPIHFQWIDDEVALLEAFNKPEQQPIPISDPPPTLPDSQPCGVAEEAPVPSEKPIEQESATEPEQTTTIEAEEQYRLQKAQEQQEQAETGILFESTDINLSGAELGAVVGQNERTGEDIVMMSVDTDQLASYGFIESDDPNAVGTHLVTQVGPNGTTIDVTNAGGEVVQQFLLPDDLQLEEGQTLVMIQGEDGQPQLAIVNQSG
uniref:C2H2-type domain-containing protein n=1 Tax=Echinostoma caproni TaxID=27848 RepID=A0A183B161_9TREM